MTGREVVQELAGSPVRMFAPRRAEELRSRVSNAVRTSVGSPTAIGETAAAQLLEPVEPFVAGLSADAVAGTEFGRRVEPFPMISYELDALLHGCRLHPRHRPTFREGR